MGDGGSEIGQRSLEIDSVMEFSSVVASTTYPPSPIPYPLSPIPYMLISLQRSDGSVTGACRRINDRDSGVSHGTARKPQCRLPVTLRAAGSSVAERRIHADSSV